MWKLTIEDDEQKQINLPLVQALYGIGREEANEIRLTERNISRRHASLKQSGDGWVVQDLDSYNGTFINGLRVAGEQHVGHGDILQLGDYRLEFVDEGRVAPPQPTAAATASTPALAQHQRPDRLVVVVGPQPGQEFFLDREHFTMGRSEDANVSVNHSSVSRFHAELFSVGNGRFEIIDKGSANGIRINGQEVRRGFIEAGDALELGDVRLRFVGAGKIFRAGFDRSQALPAVTGFDPSHKKPAGSSSILTLVGVGALLGIVGVGAAAAYVATKDDSETSAPSAQPSGELSADLQLLEEAKALRDKGDLDAAHEQIAKISPDSSTLKESAVGDIEGAWADALFKRAESSDDPTRQAELLWKIATTPTVDEGRRRKASNKLRDVGVEVPDDPKELKPNSPLPTTFRPNLAPRPTASATSRPSGTIDRQALEKPRDKMGELMSRFNTLSPAELRMLMGLCQQESNLKCAQDASRRLAELKSNPSASAAPRK